MLGEGSIDPCAESATPDREPGACDCSLGGSCSAGGTKTRRPADMPRPRRRGSTAGGPTRFQNAGLVAHAHQSEGQLQQRQAEDAGLSAADPEPGFVSLTPGGPRIRCQLASRAY